MGAGFLAAFLLFAGYLAFAPLFAGVQLHRGTSKCGWCLTGHHCTGRRCSTCERCGGAA